MFSPMQKDVLTELLNIHIGYAASLLSEMIKQRIILTIPEVELLSPNDDRNIFERVRPGFSIGQKTISSINFGPKFEGKGFLIFPTFQAKALTNACMGLEAPAKGDTDAAALNEMDFDVLKEVSNVVFNALIGEFGNLLQCKLDYSVPDLLLVNVSASEEDMRLPANIYILVLHTKILLINDDIAATILIALRSESLTLLINKIDEILSDLL